MSKHFHILNRSIAALFFALLTIGLSGCDKVVFPSQHNEVVPIENSGNAPVQKVLIEDFTGQGCGACPSAAVIAIDLQNAYPDQVVIVSVHAGPNAVAPYNPFLGWNLTTPEGEDYDASFGISTEGNPNGLVMRSKYNSLTILRPGNWGPAIVDYLSNHAEPDVDIDLEANLTGTVLDVTVNIDYLETLPSEYSLVVSITEDNIVAPQVNYSSGGDPAYPNPTATDYVHKHVLRGNMNGSWGTDLAIGSAVQGSTDTQNYSLTIDPSWNTDNLSVVAYIRDKTTDEIIQVEEQHVN